MKMTKNEYRDYAKECANRFWNESGYTYERYNTDLDAVEILPLELSKYNLKPEMEKWINALFTEETTDSRGNYLLRGYTQTPWKETGLLSLGYGDYSNGELSFWAYNINQRLIYTYCEGDTTLNLFETQEEFEKEWNLTRNWYKEHYA